VDIESQTGAAHMEQGRFISKVVECPKGHRIKLEMLSGTTSTMMTIECPVCRIEMSVYAGDIRGVVPIDESLKL
jgi:hypothetical protein